MLASPWRIVTSVLLVAAPISGVVGGGCASFAAADSPEADAAVTDADSAATSDGPYDAGRDGRNTSFCASLAPKPNFCDDFERSAPLGKWATQEQSDSGSLAIETATLTNAGRALHAAIPLITGSEVSFVRLTKPFVAQATEVDVRFAILIDALPSQGAIQICAIDVQPNATDTLRAYFMVRPAGITFVEQKLPGTRPQDFAEEPLAQTITLGEPHVIEVHLLLASTPPHSTVRVDGVVALDGDSLSSFEPGTASFTAGILYADPPAGPLSLFIDDVAVTVR